MITASTNTPTPDRMSLYADIEQAKLFIIHLRRAGYAAADRVERYLPAEEYVWLNCWKRPRQHRAARPVSQRREPEGKTTGSFPLAKK